MTLLAYFIEKDISEQLFAIFDDNEEQITESAKPLMWLTAFISTEKNQWDSDFFWRCIDTFEHLISTSRIWTMTRQISPRILISSYQRLDSTENRKINKSRKHLRGSDACERNFGKFLAKKIISICPYSLNKILCHTL